MKRQLAQPRKGAITEKRGVGFSLKRKGQRHRKGTHKGTFQGKQPLELWSPLEGVRGSTSLSFSRIKQVTRDHLTYKDGARASLLTAAVENSGRGCTELGKSQ